jgi:hypothetical protein
MKREEFIFTIGYEGKSAIVNGQAMKKYKKLSTMELAEKGLYKEALCSAIFSNSRKEMEKILSLYNENSKAGYTSPDELKRLFGVFGVPEDILKVNIVS